MDRLNTANNPLDFAVSALKRLKEEQNSRNHSFELDSGAEKIAHAYLKKGDFEQAFAIANESKHPSVLIRTLMASSLEMLKNGKEEAALKTIDLALDNCRNQVNGFPEEDLFKYFYVIASFGHGALVNSILKYALIRAEQIDENFYRMDCYRVMLPVLAVFWQEKAEELIDHILSLPSGIPGNRDECLYPAMEILIDIAMVIDRDRHDLAWTEERQEHFQRHLKHVQSVDVIESKVRFAKVFYSRSECEHQSRYIHKYYLPQELRTGIFPVDIDGIFGCFYKDCDFALSHGGIPEHVSDCVIQYKDLEMEKHIGGETVRQVLRAIAAYHSDDRAALTSEENQAAVNLNAWFIEWEKDLLNRCKIVSIDMERQVRSGDTWLSDYEIDVETQFYVRDDDPCSPDNMPDASHDDIDSDTSLLCSMRLLVQGPLFHYGSKQHWGIDDRQDHNDRPRGRRSEEIYNVRHCATFHELFSHMHMPLKHAGRIGRVYTDIIVRHQNGIRIDLKGERAVAVRDEARIREEFVISDVVTKNPENSE